jgi:hypothetical protein
LKQNLLPVPHNGNLPVFFTHGDFDAHEFIEGEISEDKLADIRLNIIARLSANFKDENNGT